MFGWQNYFADFALKGVPCTHEYKDGYSTAFDKEIVIEKEMVKNLKHLCL